MCEKPEWAKLVEYEKYRAIFGKEKVFESCPISCPFIKNLVDQKINPKVHRNCDFKFLITFEGTDANLRKMGSGSDGLRYSYDDDYKGLFESIVDYRH